MRFRKNELMSLIQEEAESYFKKKIKIRIKRKEDLDEDKELKRTRCRITKKDVSREYQKDGETKKPVEITTTTQECGLTEGEER